MRNLIIVLFIGLIGIASTSCEEMYGDFLEKAPGVDVTEDSLFTSKAQVMLLLASCYEQGLQSPWPTGIYREGSGRVENVINTSMGVHMTYSDEAINRATWWIGYQIANGTMRVNINHDRLYNARWTAVRMMHTMLDGIDNVPDADEAFKTQVKAEVRYLRAQLYFDMFKMYGGVSIVDRKFGPSELEDMKVPRSSLDETVKFILQDLEFAIPNLPDRYESNMRGRITKGTALSLKAKTLLYAASPLFNTTTPVMSMDDPANNNLIIYGNYDVNRWQQAADAAKAVLDWAPTGGIHLIEDQGVDKNYRYVWDKPDNAEVIFAEKQSLDWWKSNRPWQYLAPDFYSTAGPQPTHTFVANFYDKRDGTPMDWGMSGDDLAGKYAQLDYRFHQTIGHTGFWWNTQRGVLNFAKGPAPAGPHAGNNLTGYAMKKNIPDAVNGLGNRFAKDFIWFRLAEFYLSYAEALNEAQGPVADAYAAVNRIRARSGMPDLPAGLTKDQFRKAVQKERTVELAFEDHRWWDIRRWLVAEDFLVGDILGKTVYKNVPVTNPLTFRYEIYVVQRRTWQDRFYLYHFRTDELNKGYLVQNPGW